MRRRLIIAAAVVAGGTAAFGIPQAAQAAQAAPAKPAASAPLCLVGVHVALGSTDLIPQTNICL
jgi:hypothetical protein